jgi:pilus assembly protein CpaF
VLGLSQGDIELKPLFLFQETGERSGKVLGELVATGEPLSSTGKIIAAGLVVPQLLRGRTEGGAT